MKYTELLNPKNSAVVFIDFQPQMASASPTAAGRPDSTTSFSWTATRSPI